MKQQSKLSLDADRLITTVVDFIKNPIRISTNITDDDGTIIYTGDFISMTKFKCPVNMVIMVELSIVKSLLGIKIIDSNILIDGKVPCRFYAIEQNGKLLPYLNVLGAAKCKIVSK